ncbi:cardiolipin synthase [uncultured Shewanella sp.]|uniref:cardiolipin synthase n=1 Tax=uncultured Shewanella sp. TaxID=173975 RepID=UPI002629E25D|nr:cardiolipin synthase [uncultured Shewanella sp.]
MERFHYILTIIAVFAYWILIAGVTARIIFQRRAIGVSFAWLMVIYIFPFAGIIAYLLFGEHNIGSKRAARTQEMFKPYLTWFDHLFHLEQYKPQFMSSYSRNINALCINRLGIPSLYNNTLSLLCDPHIILKTIIKDIQQAKQTIHLEFYIWHPGGLANDVANSLIEAANRGVSVKILLDSAGSLAFFKTPWPQLMKSAGIQLVKVLAVTPFRAFIRRIDLRMHRKIIVIDNKIGYTGSMNLVDPDHFNIHSGVGKWIDIMVRLKGSSVPVLNCIHAWDWEVETKFRELPILPSNIPTPPYQSPNCVQVIPSGPGVRDEIIHQVLLQSIYQAQTSITITTPYFIPSEQLIFGLISAAQKGIDVRIIIPARTNSIMVEWASRSFFTELLQAGVKLYRFQQGLLHTKSVVIDETLSLIGTVNLDMRSLWLNFEVTLAAEEPHFTQELVSLQQDYIDDSIQIDIESWGHRALWKRIVEQFFYQFSPLL